MPANYPQERVVNEGGVAIKSQVLREDICLEPV